jgi:hypothetical protein
VIISLAASVTCVSVALAQTAPPPLSAAEQAAVFKAAGFARNGEQWSACGDPGTASYTPGAIETVKDLNGDGRPEALVTEGSSFCFGNTGTGYSLVSKQADGSWKLITGGTGIATFLATKRVDGWPDIEVGGPGFCFPVERWNGKVYAPHRHEYEGTPCQPE